jgi:hypothetical protein
VAISEEDAVVTLVATSGRRACWRVAIPTAVLIIDMALAVVVLEYAFSGTPLPSF